MVDDAGDHYRLPSKECASIDADGHCHPEAAVTTAPQNPSSFNVWFAPVPPRRAVAASNMAPISKLEVRGVMG